MTAETTTQQPVPIIVCGRKEQIGAAVIAGLKPEYQVVQFIVNPDACIQEIPLILQGQAPATSSSSLGTGDYTNRPVAVVMGGGYAETFDQVRDGVERALESSGGSQVAWLRHDGTKPAPPPGPEYGKAMVQRVKTTLATLGAEGKLSSGVYWY